MLEKKADMPVKKTMINPAELDGYLLHRLHHEMWMWCSRHPEKGKKDWPRLSINGGDIELDIPYCFACIPELWEPDESSSECAHCLLDFPTCGEKKIISKTTRCLGGLYQRWKPLGGVWGGGFKEHDERMRERAGIARQIAYLPMRKKEEKEGITITDLPVGDAIGREIEKFLLSYRGRELIRGISARRIE